MSEKKEKLISAKEIEEFRQLINEASEIGSEAVEFLNKQRFFTRKGITCKRSTETLRKKFYAKYPEAVKYTEEQAAKEEDDIVAKALKAAKEKEAAKQTPAETENTNSENE